MTSRSTHRNRLVTFFRVLSVPIFLLTFAMIVRSAWIHTNDLFHFGRGGSWWCYTIINFAHVSASVEVYDPAYAGGLMVPRGKWFFSHLAAGGGIWSVVPQPVTLAASADLGLFGYDSYTSHGRPAYNMYWVNLGPMPLILLVASALVLALWLRAARQHRASSIQGRCPTCSYDLRAHKPGDKCPECGTIISANPAKT